MQLTPTALTPPVAPSGSAPAGPAAEPGAFGKMLSAHKPATPAAPAKPSKPRAESAPPKAEAEATTLPAPADTPDADTETEPPSVAAEVLAVLNLPVAAHVAPTAQPVASALPTPGADELSPDDSMPGTTALSGAARKRPTASAEPLQATVDDKKAASPAVAAEATPHAAEQAQATRAEPAPMHIEMPRPIELPAAPTVIAPAQRSETGFGTPQVALAMPTPATAPEFREALGVQVSVLARDGVQHAELHLNPADMGPISVQIALVGTQAQVDFGAESLATRQIIESGLPELASALRDAGFTLAGGGVSQHPRGRSGGSDGEPSSPWSRRGTGADAADPIVQRVTTRLPQGAIDLYA